jgi:drug/metabolite transporter (DMT)-like permease
VAVAFSLLAAIVYGIGDFVGGLASRRASAITILLYSYPIGGVLMTAMLPAFGGTPSWSTAGYGVAGGVAGMVGVVLMYSAMTMAPMNVISPITAVLAAAVPVLFGVITGERPKALAWVGMLIGMVAVVLVSRTADDHPHGRIPMRVIAMALVSGVGFGVYFICLAQPPHDSGLWPLVFSRLASAALIVPLAWQRHAIARIRGSLLGLAALAGVFDASANLFFLLASRHGYLSVASVITSLYPAATVLLAIGLLHEHTGRVQRIGLGLAAGAIVLITV